jgi:hypothetical protein
VTTERIARACRSGVRAIEQELIWSPSGDISGSHRAGTPAVVETPPARIPAGKQPAQLHPDSSRPPSESHGMQEVWGSNPHSSTSQVRALNSNNDLSTAPDARRGRALVLPKWPARFCRSAAPVTSLPGHLRSLQEARKLEHSKRQVVGIVRKLNAMYSSGVPQRACSQLKIPCPPKRVKPTAALGAQNIASAHRENL